MPYRLRKAPKRDLYWVVGEDGSKKSHEPLPKEKATAQMKALYAAMGRMEGGGIDQERYAMYANRVPMTEEAWIKHRKIFDPANATPEKYVQWYLTPFKSAAGLMSYKYVPGVDPPPKCPPGILCNLTPTQIASLPPNTRYATTDLKTGTINYQTTASQERLDDIENDRLMKLERLERQKKEAEEKYWANQSAVSRFFNRDVVGVLTKIADVGSSIIGTVGGPLGRVISSAYQSFAPPGSSFHNNKASVGDRLLSTATGALGMGHFHPLKGKGFFGDIYRGVKKRVGRVVGRVRDVLSGVRLDYPPSVRQVIKDIGDQPISRMVVRRDPVPQLLLQAVNLLTLGKFNIAQQEANYDKMFHLCIEFELAGGSRYVLEKNEVINIGLARVGTKDTQIATVGMGRAMENTLNGILRRGQDVMKERWFVYNALTNNCQDFIIGVLRGNNQLSPSITEFVKQPLESIVQSLPDYAEKLFKGATDAAGVINVGLEGRGEAIPWEELSKMSPKQIFALMKRGGYVPSEFMRTGEGLVKTILESGFPKGFPVKFRRYFIRFQNGESIKGYKYQGRGTGPPPVPSFLKQLRRAKVSPEAYLKKARAKAKRLGIAYKNLGFSSDVRHKLQIPNADGKMVRFGSVGLGDHILYTLSHDSSAEEHRRRYLARATKIKGNWKADKYSPNSLAIGVLW